MEFSVKIRLGLDMQQRGMLTLHGIFFVWAGADEYLDQLALSIAQKWPMLLALSLLFSVADLSVIDV